MALPFDLCKEIKGEHANKMLEQLENPQPNELRKQVLEESKNIYQRYFHE